MGKKKQDILTYVALVLILILVNIIGSFAFFRLDLTTEKRYTLNESTKALLQKVEDKVLFKIYLDGKFPADFQRLQRETRQMLDEFRAYNSNIEYIFINPNESDDPKVRREVFEQLSYNGLQPVQIEVREDGGSAQQQIIPGAIAAYADKEVPVPLLLAQFASAPTEQVNSSIEKLEYTLANAIRRLVIKEKKRIGFIEGNGQLEPKYVADLGRELSQYYTVERFNLHEFTIDSTKSKEPSVADQLSRLVRYDAIIIAKPTIPFNDLDKFLIDQYIMQGGKSLWFIDAVHAEMDSLSRHPQFLAYPIIDDLNLTDWLFKYGVRINQNLLQDMVAGGVNDRRSINRWIYFPLLMPQVNHPIAKDLNAVKLEFGSTVDTIISPGIKKTFLLRSSPYSRTQTAPHMVTLQTLYQKHDENTFRQRNLPVAVLLEGNFTSVFKNRIVPKDFDGQKFNVIEDGKPSQMLVVGDGDMVKNQLNVLNPNIAKGTPLPLGYDQYTGMQYGNKDFVMNAIDYMLDDSNLIEIRSRELTLRLLDGNRVRQEKGFYNLLNTLLPIGLVLFFGLIYAWLRKRKYAKF